MAGTNKFFDVKINFLDTSYQLNVSKQSILGIRIEFQTGILFSPTGDN